MPRERGENVKEKNVKERELENLVRRSEHVAEFDYKPSACQHSYRMGVRALRMPVDNLVSNRACMVMASLEWSIRAWCALGLWETGGWREQYRAKKASVLRMEFKKFVDAFMRMPVQLVKTGRRLLCRLLWWNPYQHILRRMVERGEMPRRW